MGKSRLENISRGERVLARLARGGESTGGRIQGRVVNVDVRVKEVGE